MFTQAIVKQPAPTMTQGITTAGLGLPDHALALEQHGQYVRALEACGLAVTVLAEDPEFPDSCFIEDTCLITPCCTVLTRPGAASRAGEVQAVARAVQDLGRPVKTIQAPGTLDAGDVMMVGSHFYVGLSGRTNAQGFRQLEAILSPYGMTASAVPLETVLHLKTGISYLENKICVAHGEMLANPAFSGFTCLAVPDDEAYAANCIWVNGQVIVPDGFGKTQKLIEAAGLSTIAVDVSEFRKLDGGLSCLSLRF